MNCFEPPFFTSAHACTHTHTRACTHTHNMIFFLPWLKSGLYCQLTTKATPYHFHSKSLKDTHATCLELYPSLSLPLSLTHTHARTHTHTHTFHPSLSDYNLSLYINIHILHYLWNSSTSSEWMVWGNISTPTACTAWNGLPGWSSFSGTIRLKHSKFELLETNEDIRQMVQLPIQPQMICQYIGAKNISSNCR